MRYLSLSPSKLFSHSAALHRPAGHNASPRTRTTTRLRVLLDGPCENIFGSVATAFAPVSDDRDASMRSFADPLVPPLRRLELPCPAETRMLWMITHESVYTLRNLSLAERERLGRVVLVMRRWPRGV